MTTLTETGGARVGSANVTWPFAQLKVNSNRLELSASIIGDFIFGPSDVILIEPYQVLPLIGQGIRIRHKVGKYDEKIIFWTFQDPAELIIKIWETGFLTPGSIPAPVESIEPEVMEKQAQGGFPIKKSIAVGVVVVWNLLFLIDLIVFLSSGKAGRPLGYGALSALGMVIAISVALLWSSGVREMILKPGRDIEGMKRFLYFIIAIFLAMVLGIISIM
ncbi:hypothetical protein [Arcticibacter sp. MXS-1]|uniref:hypothetical protein n=1 Tax=Arcticibacter sp. MXS-1 TaxID=3341726 RepID=UPI0035A9A260